MSSFRWGIIACPTPRNSLVTGRKAGAIPFSHQIWIVLLTVLHTEVWLLSTHSLPHFGLSLCNPLEQISPPYINWKGTYMALIWGIKPWSATRGCRDISGVNVYLLYASYLSLCSQIPWSIAQPPPLFRRWTLALCIIFILLGLAKEPFLDFFD